MYSWNETVWFISKLIDLLYRFHATIKKLLQHQQDRFREALLVLLDLVTLRLMDQDRKLIVK